MNYPNGIKKTNQHTINYSRRGMNLEDDINQSNQHYRQKGMAYIYKKPTPIKITKVDFNNNKNKVIKEAFFMEPSTTDYNGIYQGYYIDFEAKETKNKTSFPLANIHPHQIEHLKHIIEQKGIAFLIVRFTTLNKTFVLEGDMFFKYLEQAKTKSIPLKYFISNGWLIEEKLNPRLDYLKIIDTIIGGKNEKE